ncbi:hypothetical protein PDJAM_G00143600 [Pangasius djambal]|uniref:Uncharacterized protein n=1 Tax=Pangasius djambal TaxID=1691987 RepID=A0ACC5ZEK5_9TELE|nr:hypothetical protein [Pangasius djambal]
MFFLILRLTVRRLWDARLRMQPPSDPSGAPEGRDWPLASSGRSLRAFVLFLSRNAVVASHEQRRRWPNSGARLRVRGQRSTRVDADEPRYCRERAGTRVLCCKALWEM